MGGGGGQGMTAFNVAVRSAWERHASAVIELWLDFYFRKSARVPGQKKGGCCIRQLGEKSAQLYFHYQYIVTNFLNAKPCLLSQVWQGTGGGVDCCSPLDRHKSCTGRAKTVPR